MKYLLPVLAAAVLAVPVHAEKTGVVRSTDIVTFIDGSPIESYNYNDNTYIEAENLAHYGFDVAWDAEARRLDISRASRSFTPYVDESVNEAKAGRELFVPVYDVYSTDIVTYVNGKPAGGINVGGRTLISNDYMEEYGICSYDNNSRTYSIDIIGREIADCEERTHTNLETTYIERGFFDADGMLAYGVSTKSWEDKYGSYSIRQMGNFSDDRVQQTVDNFKQNSRKMYCFALGENKIFLVSDDDFRYGLRITGARDENSQSYCGADGRLCVVKTGDRAELYKDGVRVCSGDAREDTLSIEFYDDYGAAGEYDVLYMPDYSDADGVIYYIPQNEYEPMRVFWRGEVSGGVANGIGTAYADRDAGGERYDYYLDDLDFGEWRSTVGDNVLANGSFYNGLPNGEVELYQAGGVRYIGGCENGKKSGSGREYALIDNKCARLIYSGGFYEGKRNGTGTEYAERYSDGGRESLVRFTGDWLDGNWYYGHWFEDGRLLYSGEFRYNGEEARGTNYHYYNEETGEYEVRTGRFVDGVYVGE